MDVIAEICGDFDHRVSDPKSTEMLGRLVEEFEVHYLQYHSPVNLHDLAPLDRASIARHRSIFVTSDRCGKAALLKWVMDDVHEQFVQTRFEEIDAVTLQERLYARFGEELIEDVVCNLSSNSFKSLAYDEFLRIGRNPLTDYCAITGQKTYYIRHPDDCDVDNRTAFPAASRSKDSARLALQSKIEQIHKGSKTAKVAELLRAYNPKTGNSADLVSIFGHCSLVSDISTDLFAGASYKQMLSASLFIDWLAMDLRRYLRDELNLIFREGPPRNRDMVRARASGLTLEEVGLSYNITRERVRQIEKKHALRFVSYYDRVHLDLFLSALSCERGYVSVEDIQDVYDDLADFVVYLFRNQGPVKHEFESLTWVPQLGGFLIDKDAWLETLMRRVEEMPSVIDEQDISRLAEEVCEEGSPIGSDLIKRIIAGALSPTGDVYSKAKMSKASMYVEVLRKHYTHGIRPYDRLEMLRFRNHVHDIFGHNVELPENDRAICARITDVAVLCDNGKYILPEYVRIDDDLLDEIRRFIVDSDRDTIAFYELYEKYKDELAGRSSITNWHYLQGVLRHRWSGEFYFAKDVLSKNAVATSMRVQIEAFIKENEAVVTGDDLKRKFVGIAPYTLGMAISNSTDILIWGFGQYLHASKLVVDSETVSRIKGLIEGSLVNNILSTRTLFPRIYERETEFMADNGIENHMALFSVLAYLFPDDYEFSRPFIAQKGVETVNFDSLVREYLNQFEEVAISDLKGYLADSGLPVMNFSELLENVSDDFLRAHADSLVRASRVEMTQDAYLEIETSLKAIIGSTGYVSARSFDDFLLFPSVGMRWNPYLLVSFVKRWGHDVRVLKETVDYRYLTEVFVDKKTGIRDYNSLLRHALLSEHAKRPFTTIAEMEVFLREQGLITNAIPESVFREDTCDQLRSIWLDDPQRNMNTKEGQSVQLRMGP